ncbi:MAG: hypothetical protein ACI4Q3_01590 [Kiritimatiellia bacterium]
MTNEGPRQKKSIVPAVILLLVVAAGGYFGWQAISGRAAAERRRAAAAAEEQARLKAEEEAKKAAAEQARLKAEEEARRRAEEEAKKKTVAPKPKEKTPEELWAEELAARKAVLAEIEAARNDPNAKPLAGFAGIKFAEPLKDGNPVYWGPVLRDGETIEDRGVTFAVFGPALAKPFMTLGTTPVVWVTPKTRRPYRIEFSRKLAFKFGEFHDPETTNIVVYLKGRFQRKAFATQPYYTKRVGCEFVFPIGKSTVTVGEYGQDLKLVVEREDMKLEAKAESDALRRETLAAEATDAGKLLDSKRYPQGELASFAGVKMKKFSPETPTSFCGLRFAFKAKPLTPIDNPQHGVKGFFLDYRRAKCPVFMGFDHGRADIDPHRGGVFAVRLASEGGVEGLDDGEYFNVVRRILTKRYKVEPEEKKVEGCESPELTYRVGDVTITFGPDPRGGFRLDAVNKVLAEIARQAPAGRRTRK